VTQAQLTSTAQGHNDIYWCHRTDQPVMVRTGVCPQCGNQPSEYFHDFLANVRKGDDVSNPLLVIAETVRGTDEAEEEIKVLRDAISKFAQQVHQAYHGAHPPDLSDVNHEECPRGLCRSVQHVLDPRRPRGMP